MDCSPPGLSVHGILHARILEWVGCHVLLQGIFHSRSLVFCCYNKSNTISEWYSHGCLIGACPALTPALRAAPQKRQPLPHSSGRWLPGSGGPSPPPQPTHTHTHTHTHTRCSLKPGSSIALRAGGHINQRPWVLWANQYLFIPGRAVVEPGEAQRDCKMSPVLKPLLEGRGFFVLLLPNSAWHSWASVPLESKAGARSI